MPVTEEHAKNRRAFLSYSRQDAAFAGVSRTMFHSQT